MATVLPGSAFHSSSFIRLLADLADARPAPAAAGPAPGPADTLDGWLSWTDAIALSSALKGAAAALPAGTADCSAQGGPDDAAGELAALRQAVAQVHDALALAVRSDPLLGAPAAARRAAPGRQAVVAGDADPVARLQRCHVQHQRAMDAQLAPLRDRVRAVLARQSPALARLAALDAVMAQALAPRERHLLGQAPGLVARPLLDRRRAGPAAERPHAPHAPRADAADPSLAEANPPPSHPGLDLNPAPAPDQLAPLQARWQALLLAELDHRMHPINGLLAALHPAGRAAPSAP